MNAMNRIIEPLASRCSKFRFTPLDSTSSSARLCYIANAENITVSPSVIDTLISTSSGDLRRAITYLQSASRLSSSTDPPTPITPADIQEIAGAVPDEVISDFASVIGIETENAMDIDGTRKQQGSFEPIKNKVKAVIMEGYSAAQILSQVRLLVLGTEPRQVTILTVARSCHSSSNLEWSPEIAECAHLC
jgi:replication factor C subunit 2/4